MEAIDAVDNGINQFDTEQPPRYVNNTHLSSRVGRLNLDWMDLDQSPEKENEAFQRAMALAGSEFLDSLRFHAKSWLPARLIVLECLAARQVIDPSGEIMVLDRFCPILHISDVEVRGTKMMGDTPRIIVAVGTIGTSTMSSSFLKPKGFIDVLCLQFCIWQWEQKGDESAKKQSFEYGKFADEE
ncbi:hypothetical protein RHMOL_Rhmol03G0060100 [Rhododendron molle]|uniref:Uncharacterized protein n=1 Tax=Rhododendron molle TaxID=49168 RepID=A0ACC0PAU4_RHOML|nr:hypothetical protein RHMOL_Rhmol03G0060100 [Rhododendron molle]